MGETIEWESDGIFTPVNGGALEPRLWGHDFDWDDPQPRLLA